MTGSAILIRSDAFEAAGGWSQLFDFYMEDLDLCLRLRRRGQSIWLVPDAVVAHAVSATAGPAPSSSSFCSGATAGSSCCCIGPGGASCAPCPDSSATSARPIAAGCRDLRSRLSADRQKRAWLGALALLPRILAARLRHGGDESWWKLLKPAGTVPVITLPEVVCARPALGIRQPETSRNESHPDLRRRAAAVREHPEELRSGYPDLAVRALARRGRARGPRCSRSCWTTPMSRRRSSSRPSTACASSASPRPVRRSRAHYRSQVAEFSPEAASSARRSTARTR